MMLAKIQVPGDGPVLLTDVDNIVNKFSHDQKTVTVFIAGISTAFTLLEIVNVDVSK